MKIHFWDEKTSNLIAVEQILTLLDGVGDPFQLFPARSTACQKSGFDLKRFPNPEYLINLFFRKCRDESASVWIFYSQTLCDQISDGFAELCTCLIISL
jgi:hypothetical protein